MRPEVDNALEILRGELEDLEGSARILGVAALIRVEAALSGELEQPKDQLLLDLNVAKDKCRIQGRIDKELLANELTRLASGPDTQLTTKLREKIRFTLRALNDDGMDSTHQLNLSFTTLKSLRRAGIRTTAQLKIAIDLDLLGGFAGFSDKLTAQTVAEYKFFHDLTEHVG